MSSNNHFVPGKIFLAGIFIIFLMVSCSPASSMSVTQTPTFSKFLPPTWTPTITLTPTETITPTSSSTLPPTNTAMPTFSYVAPAYPTLIDSGAKLILNRMLNQNGGCQLPCWWGIHPGKTRWDDARITLYSFVGKIEELQYTEELANNETRRHTIAVIYYQRGEPPQISSPEDDPGYFEIRSVDGIVDSISASQNTTLHFNLSNLLSEYGRPTGALINTTYASPTGEVPFNLVVYYEEKGIMAFYTEYAPIINEKIYFCFKNEAPIWLLLWNPSPAKNEQMKEAFLKGLDYWMYDTGFRSIQDASSSTSEQFYINFKDASNGSCLVTSTDTWSQQVYNFPTIPTSTPSPIYPWEEKTPTPTP